MNRRASSAFAVPLFLAASSTLGACTLIKNEPPIELRYFTIDVPERPLERRDLNVVRSPARELAVGTVRSSTFLRNRIVYRDTGEELGEYERVRWTEYPEAYLRRALDYALFGGCRRFVEHLGHDAPILDVELVAFEEVRRDRARAGRVQVKFRLHEGDDVIAADTITVERPAAMTGDLVPVVEALEGALLEATLRITTRVSEALGVEGARARGNG